MKKQSAAAVVISEQDNVATATRELKTGEMIAIKVADKEYRLSLKNDIRFLHKFALRDIRKGEPLLKYGMVMGEATRDIARGEHVHTHNVRSLRS